MMKKSPHIVSYCTVHVHSLNDFLADLPNSMVSNTRVSVVKFSPVFREHHDTTARFAFSSCISLHCN